MFRDTKSSSDTFLNHIRVSAANAKSRPHELRGGDILRSGVDHQGGTEDIYECEEECLLVRHCGETYVRACVR